LPAAPSGAHGPPRRRLPHLLTEATLIALSILLAFAVNRWWEAREDAQLAARALASFEQEIRANREQLRGVMPYHTRIRQQFTTLNESGTVRRFADLCQMEGFEGFRPAFLRDTAWRAALATGALNHLDFDTVAALSDLYTCQDRFNAVSRPDFLGGPGMWNVANLPSTLISITLYLGDMTYGAEELAEAYDAALAHLDAQR